MSLVYKNITPIVQIHTHTQIYGTSTHLYTNAHGYIQYSRKVLEQDKKSCFCQFIVSFIEILFTYSR